MIEANRVAAMWLLAVLARVSWLLPTLFKLFLRAPLRVIEATGVVITRVADLRAQLRLSLTIAFHGAARAAAEAACARGPRVVAVFISVRYLLPVLLKVSERAAAIVIKATRFASLRFADLLARLLVPLSIAMTVAGQAAVRMIEASRVGARWLVRLPRRVRWLLPLLFALFERASVRVIEATWVVGRIVVTTSGRALWLPGLSAWISTARRRGWKDDVMGHSSKRESSTAPPSLQPLARPISRHSFTSPSQECCASDEVRTTRNSCREVAPRDH
jgi:hypothetical protein